VIDRRRFLKLAAAAGFASSVPDYAESTGSVLKPRQPGMLDIHHLAYGRGNSTFALCPDGTTILKRPRTPSKLLALKNQTRMSDPDMDCLLHPTTDAGRRTRELDYVLLTHLGDLGQRILRQPKETTGSPALWMWMQLCRSTSSSTEDSQTIIRRHHLRLLTCGII
jgi:hypothetical protein